MDQKIKLSKFVTWWLLDGKTYIYSTRSGAIVKVDSETERLLKTVQSSAEIADEAQRKYLLEKAILVPEQIDEFGTFRFFSMAEQYNPTPSKIAYTIAVTESCNYRCKYCFESTTMHGREMEDGTKSAIISYLKQAVETSDGLKELRITWFGGEPLLRAKTIEDISIPIIECCENNNVEYSASVITNGSLVNESILDLFNRIKVSFVQITLDGDLTDSCSYKGCSASSFEASISAILSIAKTTRIHVRLNTDGENIQSIIRIVKRIHDDAKCQNVEHNIRFYLACIDTPDENMMPQWFVSAHKTFLEFLSSEGMQEDILLALPKARYTSCGAVTNAFSFIGTDGRIVKCEHFLGRDDKTVGTVFDGLWHNSKEAEFRDVDVREDCVACSYYPICRQGCLAKRLEEHRSMNCDLFKENIKNILSAYLAK